ncbi:MAG TPA: glycosyltransferase family 1 protein [Actinomycetota bacterium]|nr:glycosyltransferase family 1 protein [Actinomycetota bacterium]
MRIAFDAAPLLNPRTGVGHYTAALADHLLAADPGLELSLFAVGRQPVAAAMPGGDRATLRRLRVPARLVVGAWELAGRPPGDVLFGEVDAVHGTNFWIPPLRRRNGLVTIHDLTFLLHPEFCTPRIRRYRWILPRVLRRCAVVLTPSETVAGQVASELAFPRDRIVVTPEGVRSSALGTSPQVKPSSAPAGEYVLFTGTHEPRKNLGRLLGAFARLGDLDLALVVAGRAGWGPENLRQSADELGIAGRVSFTGYLPDEELAALLAGARAFVFPSIYEGFGLPPLEAMAAGIPVVAAQAGSLPEVLGDAPFWCDPFDVESMAAAIRTAVTDEGRRATATAAGRARAARYDWADTARLTLDAYRLAAS